MEGPILKALLSGLALALAVALPARADGLANVSAYCETGYTASGLWTTWGEAAGAPWLPLGSLVWVGGYGTVVIEDRGQPGLFDLDLAMPGDCPAAWQWGRQYRPIRVLRWGW